MTYIVSGGALTVKLYSNQPTKRVQQRSSITSDSAVMHLRQGGDFHDGYARKLKDLENSVDKSTRTILCTPWQCGAEFYRILLSFTNILKLKNFTEF